MLSIIICTYNREKYIYNVLKSIAVNDFPTKQYEIVLINNNSTDQTELECKRFQENYPQIIFRYFIEFNQGLSHARNKGIKESQGDILIYVDDDATVSSDYLQSYSDFFINNEKAFAAGGPILPVYETKKPKWMSYYTKLLLTGYLYRGDKIFEIKQGQYPGGGNAAYRKTVFEQVGMFNVDLGRKGNNLMGSEEKDIFDKMRSKNMAYFYLPKPILYHIIPESKLMPDYFKRLTYAIGQGEKIRTLQISKKKYLSRIFSEIIKWMVSFIMAIGYTLAFSPQKGWKLLQFRWNVSKGLLKNI